MLERPPYQLFTESVGVVDPPEFPPVCASEETPVARPAEVMVPCLACGSQERWNDHGVQRCRTCWPHPLTRKTREAERAYQRTARSTRFAHGEQGSPR